MHKPGCRLLFSLALAATLSASASGKAGHVVVVVWDGMRADSISREHTPTLYQVASEGVLFANHHSAYCTSTEVNGTAIATGVYPEHSGIIANRMYLPGINARESVDTQNPKVIAKGDEVSRGHYIERQTLAEILQATGVKTAIAGSKSVALLHNRNLKPKNTSGSVLLFGGETLPPATRAPLRKLLGTFPVEADKTNALPNEPRDEWTTRALLESFWSDGVPAYSVLWLSEPDFSQHAAGLGSPKALAAVESSDRKLAQVLAELKKRGLQDKTDVFVVSDHGFSTVEKSVDVCKVLSTAGFRACRELKSKGKPGDILVVGQGGSILFYVIGHDAATLRKLVEFLQQQDFAGVLFTREPVEGTFTLDQACLHSSQPPDVVMSMRWSEKRNNAGTPGLQVSDGNAKPGQGNHGSLSRFDVHNILVATGPDLKSGYTDALPTGNVDLAPTILWLLGVQATNVFDGRVLSEAMTVDAPPAGNSTTRRLEARHSGEGFQWSQYLQVSQVDQTVYLDEGGGSADMAH